MVKKLPDKVVEPNKQIREEIYKLYRAIFRDYDKEKLMTYIFAWHPWSWRIGMSRVSTGN